MTPKQREWLRPVVEADGFYTVEHIEKCITDGSMEEFAFDNCIGIAEVKDFPSGLRALNIFAVAGERGKSLETIMQRLEPVLVAWGRAHGCHIAMGMGVKDWGSVWDAMGYRRIRTVVAKDLA